VTANWLRVWLWGDADMLVGVADDLTGSLIVVSRDMPLVSTVSASTGVITGMDGCMPDVW